MMQRVTDRIRSTALVLLALMGAGCGEPVEPAPRPASLDAIDPWVAATMKTAWEEADRRSDDPAAWEALGEVYLAHDYHELAARSQARALGLDADRSRSRYLRAFSLRALDDLPGATTELDLALAADPATPHLRWRGGLWHLEAGDVERALILSDEGVRLAPQDRNAIRVRAKVLLAAGRSSQALQVLMPLVRRDPGDTEVQRLLGAVLRAEGRTDEARRAFLRAGSAEPNWFDDWVNQAMVHRTDLSWCIRRIQRTASGGRPDAARAMLAELRSWHPDARECDFTEAVVLVAEDRNDEAIALFESLLEADPTWNAPRIRAAAARLARAATAVDPDAASEDREVAAAHLARGIELEPDSEDVLLLGAIALESLGRFEAAAKNMQGVVDVAPGIRTHRLRLARLLIESGRPVEAVAVLDQAVADFGPEGPPAMVVRIDADLAAGRDIAAAVTLEELARRAPRHPELSRLRESVAKGGERP